VTNVDIRKMVMAILTEADYDLAKSYDPKLSEDPEHSEASMDRLIAIARRCMYDASRGKL